jgi:hypothetical protein
MFPAELLTLPLRMGSSSNEDIGDIGHEKMAGGASTKVFRRAGEMDIRGASIYARNLFKLAKEEE